MANPRAGMSNAERLEYGLTAYDGVTFDGPMLGLVRDVMVKASGGAVLSEGIGSMLVQLPGSDKAIWVEQDTSGKITVTK